jgi:transposase
MAHDLAIEALEKQIPKKVIRERATLKECPICGIIVNHTNYCSNCGQKLDYS